MAAADYAIVRRRMGKQTRMTKHEVKQESKQTEGDPLLKGAIRSRQLAAARNRMMADVPTADVVLVNPTHVAVALTLRRRARRPPRRGPRRRRGRAADPRAAPPSTAYPSCATSRWPARCTAPPTVGQEIPRRALRRRRAGAGLRHLPPLHGGRGRRAPQPAPRGRPARRPGRRAAPA